MGLPITERAFGPDALTGNYAIISIHAPLFYGFGIAVMEWARARGNGLPLSHLGMKIVRAIGSQPLVIGIAAGFVVNFAGFGLYGPVQAAVNMIAGTAIPTALFGLGGVLVRYRPEGDAATIAMICACSLVLHPALTYIFGHWVFGLGDAQPAIRGGDSGNGTRRERIYVRPSLRRCQTSERHSRIGGHGSFDRLNMGLAVDPALRPPSTQD